MKSNPFPFAQLGSNCVQKTRGSLYLNLPDSLRRVPIDTGTSILLEQLNSNQVRQTDEGSLLAPFIPQRLQFQAAPLRIWPQSPYPWHCMKAKKTLGDYPLHKASQLFFPKETFSLQVLSKQMGSQNSFNLHFPDG